MEIEKQIERLKDSIENLNNKNFKILYYVPDMKNQASGGIGVIYQHVKSLNELGFNAMILSEKKDYTLPTWLGKEFTTLPHISTEGSGLSVTFEDILVIPEGFTNVMEQTKALPCRRVVFAQSWAYILNALVPGMTWANFGISDVMSVGKPIGDYITNIMGDRFNIVNCEPSISDVIFKPSVKPKKPFIAISAREQFMMLHVIKQFYLQFPEYKWVSFKDMKAMDREDFAETLGESFLSVWVDRVSGFGTYPIESAKCDTPFIGLIPDVIPEYADDENGIWTSEITEIPQMIGSFINMWLQDTVSDEITDSIKGLKLKYTIEEEKNKLEKIYTEYLTNRIEQATKALVKFEGEEQNG